jgi:hypothetical protein
MTANQKPFPLVAEEEVMDIAMEGSEMEDLGHLRKKKNT